MTPDNLLTIVHVMLLLGIFGFVASYRPDDQTRYRPVVSIFAAALAGASLAMVAQIVTQWDDACKASQPWQTLFSACVFFAVAHTRGNVAKLLPRLKWTTHT